MKSDTPSPSVFQRKMTDFCRLRVDPFVSNHAAKNIRGYMMGLIIFRKPPPTLRGRLDWAEIATECDIEDELSRTVKKSLQPGLEAIARWLKERETERALRASAAAAKKAAARIQAKRLPAAPLSERDLVRPRRVA